MAKLDRKEAKIFAENCVDTLVTQFRTESADGSTASYSRDPDVIQNSNYVQGWVENTNNLNTKIYGEDMNAVNYVITYLLKYLYENGIPEWSSATTYYTHSITRVDNALYISLQDNNTNNDPTSTTGYWQEIPLQAITTVLAGSGFNIVKGVSGNELTFKSISIDGYGSITDTGDQLNFHILGGSGIVDAYWGQIQGTLTNQTDLVTALGDKQDNLTFDSPLSKDVNNEVSIPKATDSISGYLDSEDFQTFAGKQDALSGFTHSYDTDTDTAEIYPTATNSNIGTSTYPITNVNTTTITTTGSATIGGTLNTGNVKPSSNTTYDIGDSNYNYKHGYIESTHTKYLLGTGTSGTKPAIFVGADTVIQPVNASLGAYLGRNSSYFTDLYATDVHTQGLIAKSTSDGGNDNISLFGSIVPDTDNTYDLGSASKRVANLFSNNSTADWNKSVYNSSTLTSSMKFGTAYYKRGSEDNGEISQILNITSDAPNVNDGITNTHILPYIPGNSLMGSRYNYCNLGATNNRFWNVWSEGFNGRIGGGGRFLVGQLYVYYLNGNCINLYPSKSSDVIKLGTSSQTGSIQVETSSGSGYWNGSAWATGSDEKLKKNIETNEERAIDKINQLRVVDFNWKREDDKANKHTGFIANEVEKVIPSAVSRAIISDDSRPKQEETLFLDKMEFIPYLVKAVQELSAKVDSLEKRVAELEGNKEEKEFEK